MTAAPPDPTLKPLIFLSHSSRDKLVAEAICARLEQQGIRCWIAPRDVNPGRDYSDQIAEALERSEVMVIIFSSGSNASRHVKSEIDRAFSLGRIIVPFRVEDIEPEKGLAYYLAKTHWLDAVSPPLEQHIDRLAATIRKLLAHEDAAPVLVPQESAPVAEPTARGTGKVWWMMGLAAALLVALAVFGFSFIQSRQHQAAPASPEEKGARPARSLAGSWNLTEGRGLDGAPYSGTVRLNKQGQRYQVDWRTSAGNHSGLALSRGNKLCVGWGAASFGVVLYRIEADGSLDGVWTVIGAEVDKSDGVERASGGVPGRLEGHYTVTGSNPGGQNSYGGELEIARTGETYRLDWKVGSTATNGVGIRIGDDLFVAWGEKPPFGVASYTFDGETAEGVWTLSGESMLGREKLVRQ